MDVFHLVILSVTALSALCLTGFYLLIFNKINLKKLLKESPIVPVSIIIAARNEQRNLEKNLAAILTQDYPDFEVIVVNDGSFDGTADLLKEYKVMHPHLKVVDLKIEDQYRKGKKFALTMGIKAAANEQLLFTDADCYPNSSQWISAMMRSLNNRDIVLGYAPLKKRISPLGAIYTYETFHTAVQYMSYALSGRAYMGVGRNLSYTKSLFFKNKGFASHQHLLSGDDDLFVQEVATKKNVAICFDPDGYMVSEAPKGFFSYIKQKLRHMSTSSLYQGRFKRLLGAYSAAQIFFYAGVIASVFHPQLWYIAGSILLFKWLVQWMVFFQPAKKMGLKLIAFLLPIYDILYTFYLFFFALIRPFIKPTSWK